MTRIALLFALVCFGCSGAPTSPEDEISSLLERFKLAASERDVGAALDLVSEEYGDPSGRDKDAVKALVLQYFLGHEAIHVLYSVRSLELAEPPDAARVGVATALTGAPVTEVGELEELSADLFRFDLVLAREDDGQWRIRSARWKRTQFTDFF